MESNPHGKRQLTTRPTHRSFKAMLPTAREVSLARLLLQLIDNLGRSESLDADLYNEVKHIAEAYVRGAK